MKKKPEKYTPFSGTNRRAVERLDSRFQEIDLLRSSHSVISPVRLIILMSLSIFVVESFIMLALNYAPVTPPMVEVFLDSTALLILISPVFYFFYYAPLKAHHNDRAEITEKLLASEERLNLALGAVNDGLWDWNILTGDVYASVRSATILGFQPGEMGNQITAWNERLHPDESAAINRQLKHHLSGEADYYCAEHRLRHKDGHYVWVLARGRVVEGGADTLPRRMIGTYTDITQRKEVEEALLSSNEDIRRLSRKLMEISEEDKKHLAQDLHDEFGQVLCAFQLGVEMLRDHNYGAPNQHGPQCDRLLSLIARLEVDLRQMCDHLRPVILDDLGLVPALKWHLEQFAAQSPEVKVEFRGTEIKVGLEYAQEITLYRICQEALSNASKYSEADEVLVELQQTTENILLSIRDNGIGFSEEDLRRKRGGWGLGLLGMRERAAAVQGTMMVESSPGQGTTIEIVVPLLKTFDDLPEETCG